MTHPLKPTNCIAVEVERDSHYHMIDDGDLCYRFGKEAKQFGFALLPPGTYTLIGVWPEMSEEQAEKVV